MVHRVPFFLPWLFPNLVWKINTTEKELFLTFDDGPVPGPTEFVLDTLGKFNCKATFFCIGDNIRKHPEVFQRLVDDGHAIRSEEHTSELQSQFHLVCRLLLEKKKQTDRS